MSQANKHRQPNQNFTCRRLCAALAILGLNACYGANKPVLDVLKIPTSVARSAPAVPVAVVVQKTDRIPVKADSLIKPRADDVVRTAANVFGDTTAAPPLPDSAAAAGPTWDINVRSYENQERVAFYVNLFSQSSRARFQERLRLGTRYEPMIRAKLRAGGIPEDMSYLAMVESGFDPNAYSSAAAVGMWQFMSSTARDVGLRVDWWVDERRDPARSTDAAIRFLRDLQSQFGSLYLAAAAYNGGPGRVSRGLTRFAEQMNGMEGEDKFFALAEHDYLRSETKNYVPQIIAAALVGKEPVRYGFRYDTLLQYSYDSVEVSAGVPLTAIAKASSVDVATVKELNPAVLRGIVPPGGSLWMRVPLNPNLPAERIATTLREMPENELTGYHTLKSAGTESATSIATKAGITAHQLALFNPGLKSTRKGKLIAGQSVRVPTLLAVAGATNAPDPGIEHYGSSTLAATRSGSVHIVKRGETLAAIASRFHLTEVRLKSLDGLRGNRVVAGQALRVRAAPPLRAASVASSKATKSSGSTVALRHTPVKKKVRVATTKPSASKASKTVASKSKKPMTMASSRSKAIKAAPKKVASKSVQRAAPAIAANNR